MFERTAARFERLRRRRPGKTGNETGGTPGLTDELAAKGLFAVSFWAKCPDIHEKCDRFDKNDRRSLTKDWRVVTIITDSTENDTGIVAGNDFGRQ